MRSEKEKMLAGADYRADDPDLQAEQAATRAWLARYNAALAAPPAQWHALLRERLGAVGPGAVIRPPFHCDYGWNIRLGDGVFLNYGCVALDVAEVAIGARAARAAGAAVRRRSPAARSSAPAARSSDVPDGATVAGNPARRLR